MHSNVPLGRSVIDDPIRSGRFWMLVSSLQNVFGLSTGNRDNTRDPGIINSLLRLILLRSKLSSDLEKLKLKFYKSNRTTAVLTFFRGTAERSRSPTTSQDMAVAPND